MKVSSLIARLGNRDRIGNQIVICMLSVLAMLPAWFSLTGFEQPLILASFINTAYGQQGTPSPQSSTPFLEWYQSQGANQQTSNPLSVQITSPGKGQQVPAGRGLIVSGVSSDNSTSECKVSVIVNGEKPYQPAIASGTSGINDYSNWSFMIAPTYTTIKEGPDNKITSKLECTPNLTKWYSVNVTGVGTTTPLDRAGTVMQPPPSIPSSPFASEDDNPDGNPPVGSSDAENFGPLSGEESDPDSSEESSDSDTAGSLFDEDSNSDEDEDSNSDEDSSEDTGELFE